MEAISQEGYIDMLERVQRRATNMIQKLRNISYEMRLRECGLTTLETRILRGDQIDVFTILNGVTLAKKQCRLDI